MSPRKVWSTLWGAFTRLIDMKKLFSLLLAAIVALPVFAQDPEPVEEQYIGGIPASVFYLMPSFSDGMVYFYSQTPAQGKLNICAVDHSLRFLDKDGKDLEARSDQGILKVRIDTVWFIKSDDFFYRMYPVTPEIGVALRREVRILRDAKEGAYGMVSHTSAIREINKVYADGFAVDLNKDKKYPYEIKDMICLYKWNAVVPFSKKSLKKLFPAKKDQIDAYFQAHKSVPGTLDKAMELVTELAKTE